MLLNLRYKKNITKLWVYLGDLLRRQQTTQPHQVQNWRWLL